MIAAIAEDYRRDLAGFDFYSLCWEHKKKQFEPCRFGMYHFDIGHCLTGHVISLDPLICQNKFVIKSHKCLQCLF